MQLPLDTPGTTSVPRAGGDPSRLEAPSPTATDAASEPGPLVARLWHTRIDPARADAYDAFARDHSRPMFDLLEGCLAALFLGSGAERTVLTLWTSPAALDALSESVLYADTVARFHATGILREPQHVERVSLTGGTVQADALAAALRRSTSELVRDKPPYSVSGSRLR